MTDSTGTRWEREELGRRNHEDLLKLRHGWDECFEVSVEYPGSWSAKRRDNGTVLEADSAEGLRRKIIDDYVRHPVAWEKIAGGQDA